MRESTAFCSFCSCEKPVSQFYQHQSQSSLRNICKACMHGDFRLRPAPKSLVKDLVSVFGQIDRMRHR